MSVFDSDSTHPAELSDQHPTTSAAIMIFIIISAVGLSVVVGFIFFVAWYRMKKRREQHEVAVELVEPSQIEAVMQNPPVQQRQEVGMAY
ncbi:uncharacterized protein ALTATR162_LOCUS7622 [Alternaria atra]|uniref:Uncharacterized protein n=1 Tax=Alternaria atra TaxID=119953 RepID=A0A8J2I8W9_9PLEO|nr:uncharacterized protein ALTATR162_LOCUS7622 [Alternaria atra]CAG5173393.1 unnamed protein product [Alternaria atra]